MNDAGNAVCDTSFGAIRAQILLTDGTPWGASFQVNSTEQGDQTEPAITTLADGRFVVAWLDQSESRDDPQIQVIRAQIFTQDGSKSGDEFLVGQPGGGAKTNANVRALPDGGLLCV